jgi:hypothetical protein
MLDPASQLARLHQAGFTVETYERFPRTIAVARNQIIALLEATPDGLRLLGTPGWRTGVAAGGPIMAVLVEEAGKQLFRAKDTVIPASPERLAELKAFREELQAILAGAS